MLISSISTSLIHNHAPVLENATILKNAGKQHFAGVSANNRNQSYFIGIFLQTTPIVQKFSTVSIELIQFIRAYALPDMNFLVNHIYPISNTISPIIKNPIISLSTLQHLICHIRSLYRYTLSLFLLI